jgi:hypothetical protein
MKRSSMIVSMFAAASLFAGCGDDTTVNGNDMAGADLSVNADMTTHPPPPTLGLQIDRMGRAAINTALTDPFFLAGPTMEDQTKDSYNIDGVASGWVAQWGPRFEPNLAILDAMDGICGNQALASSSGADAGTGRYLALANTLADDQLYVDTTRGDCTDSVVPPNVAGNYLAVEARAVAAAGGPLPALPGCGGRTPTNNTIDLSYTLIGEGTDFASAGFIVNGVDVDVDPAGDAGAGATSITVFPFLGQPNP